MNEFSDRLRSRLFIDRVEMSENIERNLLEFQAENGDWREACLEDEMYLCGLTGELIHPVHVQRNQYVFGVPETFPRSSLESERQKYWNDKVAI